MICFDLSHGWNECEGFVHSKADGSQEQLISMSLILIRLDHAPWRETNWARSGEDGDQVPLQRAVAHENY